MAWLARLEIGRTMVSCRPRAPPALLVDESSAARNPRTCVDLIRDPAILAFVATRCASVREMHRYHVKCETRCSASYAYCESRRNIFWLLISRECCRPGATRTGRLCANAGGLVQQWSGAHAVARERVLEDEIPNAASGPNRFAVCVAHRAGRFAVAAGSAGSQRGCAWVRGRGWRSRHPVFLPREFQEAGAAFFSG